MSRILGQNAPDATKLGHDDYRRTDKVICRGLTIVLLQILVFVIVLLAVLHMTTRMIDRNYTIEIIGKMEIQAKFHGARKIS